MCDSIAAVVVRSQVSDSGSSTARGAGLVSRRPTVNFLPGNHPHCRRIPVRTARSEFVCGLAARGDGRGVDRARRVGGGLAAGVRAGGAALVH
jgi:hypothetical protein